jgi:hypothetical protein
MGSRVRTIQKFELGTYRAPRGHNATAPNPRDGGRTENAVLGEYVGEKSTLKCVCVYN